MAPTEPSVAVVVSGGDPPDQTLVDALDLPVAGRVVVAADAGIAHALALGLGVDVAVGDFDSIEPATLARVEASGARVDRHPVAKDATDLELALDAALATGAGRIVLVGGHGGRLDHFLTNVSLLCAAPMEAVQVDALVGEALVSVLRPGRDVVVRGRPGELVSIVPLHGPVEGVRTTGLRYPLRRETLPPGTSRGVSNELLADTASVSVDAGTALVIRPCSPPEPDHTAGAR